MADFETSVDAGAAAGEGESLAVSSDSNEAATTNWDGNDEASDGGYDPVLAAVESVFAGHDDDQLPVDSEPAQPNQPATEEDQEGDEPDALKTVLEMDEEAFAKADSQTRSTGFKQLRSHVQELNTKVQTLEPDAKLGSLLFEPEPVQFLNELAEESPEALSNLINQIAIDVPDILIQRLQAAGHLPADLNATSPTVQTNDVPEDLPTELHEYWKTLDAELRDDLLLDSAAKRNDYLSLKNQQYQAEKARTEQIQQEAAAAESRRVEEYETSTWSAVMQQVAATPLTGDAKVDAVLHRLGANAAYHDSMRKDPTVAALMQQADAAIRNGETRKAMGIQATLIAAGKAHTLKALEPVIALARENAQLKQRLQKSQPQRFSVANNGNQADANASQSLGSDLNTVKQNVMQNLLAQFPGLPAN
jgi:hypothetical protein